MGNPKKKVKGIEVSPWIWAGVLALLPVVMILTYQAVDPGSWWMIFAVIYAVNILLAGVTIRGLKKLKDNAIETQEKQAKEEALISSLGEGIVVTDKNGDVELINHQAELMIGWKLEEVVGKKWYDVAPLQNETGEVIPSERRATQKVFETGEPVYSSVNYYVRRDGSRFPVGTTASPVVVNEKTVGVIAVFRDITKEKEVDRAKTEFVSLASHQLRTPLSAIKWYAEMLANGDAGELNPEQAEFVKCLYQSNERMVDLVNSLLNISRLEMGKIKIEPSETDLGELVKTVLSDLEPRIKSKNQQVTVSVNEDVKKVMADPKLVTQVYLNLLSNAVKYTPEKGTITINISVEGNDVVSKIKDTGYGIPKEDQKRLFERFFRATNAQKNDVEGTGLGLYLVRAIVEACHGRVWFESEENKGTTFWFTLPLVSQV